MTVGAALGFVREWASTGALLALLTLSARLYVIWRKLNTSDFQVERAGYGELIGELRTEVTALRGHSAQCETKLATLQGSFNTLQYHVVVLSLRYAIPKEELTSDLREMLAKVDKAMAGA